MITVITCITYVLIPSITCITCAIHDHSYHMHYLCLDPFDHMHYLSLDHCPYVQARAERQKHLYRGAEQRSANPYGPVYCSSS